MQRAFSFHSNCVCVRCVIEKAAECAFQELGRVLSARCIFFASAATRAMQLLHISAARRPLSLNHFSPMSASSFGFLQLALGPFDPLLRHSPLPVTR
jgi:hypothetical protein